jgi:hypothetical protein
MGFIEPISSGSPSTFREADRRSPPSVLSSLSIVVPQQLPALASGASSRSGTRVSKCKLTDVCQSRQPLSLKRFYRRREVVLPLQWPYASGVENSSGLASSAISMAAPASEPQRRRDAFLWNERDPHAPAGIRLPSYRASPDQSEKIHIPKDFGKLGCGGVALRPAAMSRQQDNWKVGPGRLPLQKHC